MKKGKFSLVGVLAFVLMFFGFGQAVASDLIINTCRTFASLDGSPDDDDGLTNGVLTVNGSLTIGSTGCITCNDPLSPTNASACPIRILVDGNFVMEIGSKIQAENKVAGGNGGNIEITVGGDAHLKGGTISSSKVAGAGDTGKSGNITLTVAGNVTIDNPANIWAGGAPSTSGNGGAITITSGNNIKIDGDVLSIGGTTIGKGGPITIIAPCDLRISYNGRVISRGQDHGADRVHLEGGCIVQVFGVVASTAPGHLVSPKNLCIPPHRPDKPANSNACVEIWAGDSLEIDSTSPANGEINADTAMSGGTQGTAWIDLFARGDIIIIGDTAGPYAVHANQTLSGGRGGTIRVASRDGKVETSGRAIQANCTAGGGKGGKVFVEASGSGSPDGDVDFGSASIQARGSTGGGTAGGLISARSFNGKVLGSAPGELNASGGGLPGLVRAKACLGVIYTGTVSPPPLVIDSPACGGLVVFEGYVQLPPCVCGCVCVSSFSPKAGAAGSTVTIKGTGLKSVTKVFFNPADCDPEGTAASIISKTDTQIKITVPGLAKGKYRLVINVEGLQSICMADQFEVP